MWNSKPKKRTCNCRRRAKYNPKLFGGGCCYGYGLAYREAVVERIASKSVARRALVAARSGYADDFED